MSSRVIQIRRIVKVAENHPVQILAPCPVDHRGQAAKCLSTEAPCIHFQKVTFCK